MLVGAVHKGVVERSQVNARSLFRGVSHPAADNRQRNSGIAGNCGPGVPGGIRTERERCADSLPEPLQQAVIASQGDLVFAESHLGVARV